MESTPLEGLLSCILSADNVLRKAAEKELEQRSSTAPDFCVTLAHYCGSVVGDKEQRALALVAFSVLKRSLSNSIHYEELQQVVSLFLGHLGDVAVGSEVSVATVRQWNSVVATGVHRLAVLRVTLAASPARDAAAVAACFESVSNLITSQLLHAFAHLTQATAAEVSIVHSHVYLLQSFFEEPVPEATHVWCAELVASCVSPLLGIVCSIATAQHAAAKGVSSLDEYRARCALQVLVAQTLCVLYEWQFAASRGSKFPADLRNAFIQTFPSLQTYLLVPCAQWAAAAVSPTAADDASGLSVALSRAAPLIAASLATQELLVKVLQYGGWYKRCASAELLQGILNSLEADVVSYQVALSMEDGEEVGGGSVPAMSSGGRVDSWVAVGDGAVPETAELVRCHVTQRWTLFRDVALLPFLQRGFIDVVGDQCGRRYYELLLAYAVLAPSEADAWLDDPNIFLREEEEREDGVRWTARETVAQLYTDSITALGPLFLHATLEDLNARLFSEEPDDATAAMGATHQGTQKQLLMMQREARLFFMEVVLRQCSKNLRECGVADFTRLAAHIWGHDVAGPTAHAATSARALMLLTAIVQFSGVSPQRSTAAANPTPTPAALNAFMATAVAESAAVLATLASPSPAPSCSLFVAVVLCRFLQSTLPYWPPTVLEQHFAALQNSLLFLLSPQVGLNEEVLYGTVEQLTDLLHAAQRKVRGTSASSNNNAGQVSLVSERLPAIVMDCWRRHVSDPSFADVVLQLLRRVVRDGGRGVAGGTSGSSALSQLLLELSWVNNVLCGYADSMAEVCAVPYFLRLLRFIFTYAPDEVANEAATLMLDSLCQLLLCTDESAILVASSSCLAALLRRCPSAQSLQVQVVAASVEAALSGTDSAVEQGAVVDTALLAHAPRAVYPFSAVVVAIVLRTLQDARGEASLLEMGQTLVTIMRRSSSFSEADLLRVVHATVHRLGVVRTDTVTQQLLAPLATLLLLYPAVLLRTLVQGGLLAETMAHWLPRVEYFTNLSVTYSSCEGLLGLLQMLSESARASMTAEECQQVAQQPVSCRWKLPEDVCGGAPEEKTGSRKSTKRNPEKKGGKSFAHQTTFGSTLVGGAVVETSLPLYTAILVAVGRGLLTLLGAPLSALRRASQPDNVDLADNDGESGSSFSSEDDDGVERGNRLFQEDSNDDNDGDNSEESWDGDEEEEVDSFEGHNGDDGDATASPPLTQDVAPPAVGGRARNEKMEKERIVAAMGAQLLPWMQRYGNEVSPYFTAEETRLLMLFFASAANSNTV
ncbi:hypothetical protein ABB37_05133 [Leptomonas pyrrhocoris]|uniref:Uncharacterized protein n=1 Tax=Leptomonas pyrrhocoris TaxID=157538 RepID=A0A0N0VF53_LEPPY|nr:hypothetical protein ABB37_05133 [Leptomonas pyrrhocoris]KPA80144.1 hypothetical protein ABB37_05133 [Leptomonas pyrrhocoris]|eukprot:XP_015658583.1 hypothetical protein ABB37_05133 [Leptomonas pyrrhocoris]